MLNIADVKAYLRIDGDAEDAVLNLLIPAAESIVQGSVTDYDKKVNIESFRAKADMVQLLLVSEMFENRSIYTEKNPKDYSYTVRTMLEQLRYESVPL